MKKFKETRNAKQGRQCLLTRFLIALFSIHMIFAFNVYGQQNVTVSRTINDTQGQPLPGAAVLEEGTTNGTVTNSEGNYTINVPGDTTLIFSSVGMTTQNVAVNSRTQINIQMKEETTELDEVVAIGYGTQSSTLVTSSASEVDAEETRLSGDVIIIRGGTSTSPNSEGPYPYSAIKFNMKSYQVPVLKNLNENPVLQFNLNQDNDSVETELVSLNLNVTDDFNDIKTLRIWYSAIDSVLNQNKDFKLFGESGDIEGKIKIKGSQLLRKGDNFFRISVELNENSNLHNKIGVSVSKINLSDNTKLKPNPNIQFKQQRIGVAVRKHMDDNVHTYRIPGLTTTNNGTLLAVYDARRESGRDLQGDIDIGVSRSTDGGNTWEPMRIGLDMGKWGGLPEKFNGVSDACILVDRNSDKIFLAGLWMYGVINAEGIWQEGLTEESSDWNHQWKNKGSQSGFGVKETSQFLITTSTDDGKTWGEPVNITQMCKKEEWWLFAPAPGHGIIMEDGTLVFPTQGRDKTGETFSNITFSKDGGKTWKISNPAYSNTTENMVVQLDNCGIMLNARYNPNRNNQGEDNGRVVATTNDLGETWEEHPTSRNALIESTCMASIHKHVYHDNGEEKSILVFSNPNTKIGRHHMTLKVSFDDGETWPEDYWTLLDEGRSKYSCITSIDENTIGILYEGSMADMTFESIPLSEILMKKMKVNK